MTITAIDSLDTVRACVDCVFFDAGVLGESEGPERCAEVAAAFEATGIAALSWTYWTENGLTTDPGAVEYDEPVCGFSWSPCQICGTTLGGDRYTVAYAVR